MNTYALKPRFQALLRPFARQLFAAGVTANQITVTACLISFAIGVAALWHPEHNNLFLLIAFWCPLRMAANALDGMLAREFGQASRLGAILNELGDVVSDVALYLPFAFVTGAQPWLVVAVVLLVVLSEFAGVLCAAMGKERRHDGPLGKSDRALLFGMIGLLQGCGVPVAAFINWVWAATLLLLMLTLFNRARSALGTSQPGSRH
jgi:CDP-diacylglycerol--glycerol-3-phosphate 3-phosphatidyltransferase